MNEEMFQNEGDPANGPGKLLQDAREEKNFRPEDVAYELRLTATQVLALEENDYSRMPEETYVRGYLRNYARLVGVPENDILMSFARFTRGSELPPQAVLPTSENVLDKTSSNNVRLLSLGLVVAVVILSAVWVLIPQDNQVSEENKTEDLVVKEKLVTTDIPVGASTLNLNKSAEKTAVDADTNIAKEVIDPASDTSAGIASGNEPAGQAENSPSLTGMGQSKPASPGAGVIQSEISQPDQVATVTETVAATPVATSDGTLFINYSKDSWTDVRDANGKKLLYRTVKKGEKIALAGKLPITLFFGFAQGVNVTFNGVDVDINAHTRGVFARFTVGEPANP